jgi:hypothetical protein
MPPLPRRSSPFGCCVLTPIASGVISTVSAGAWLAIAVAFSPAADWPQFRGPGGTGLAVNSPHLPTDVGPEATSLQFKVDLPTGHSSPVLVGNRIYLTGMDEERRLITLCLDRRTGRELWRRSRGVHLRRTEWRVQKVDRRTQRVARTEAALPVAPLDQSPHLISRPT